MIWTQTRTYQSLSEGPEMYWDREADQFVMGISYLNKDGKLARTGSIGRWKFRINENVQPVIDAVAK